MTNKQQEIVDLVHKYRFANRIQIQRSLKHKDARRINAWLKELTDWGYLGRIYSNKLLENTKPAIYYLSTEGIAYLKEYKHFSINEVKKFYEDKNRSQTFIDHCVFICELLTGLKTYDNEIRTYKILTKEQLIRNEHLKELKPDAYIVLYKKKTKKSKAAEIYSRNFLDLFDPGIPRYAIRYRINQYIKYHEEESWKEYADNFPYIILIFPTQQKQNQFVKFIKKELTEGLFTQGMTFLLTTYQKAKENGLTSGIWQEAREE